MKMNQSPFEPVTAKWVTWYNIKSGTRTTRAHIVSSFLAGRTACGWLISTLTSTAPRTIPRCRACVQALKLKRSNKL